MFSTFVMFASLTGVNITVWFSFVASLTIRTFSNENDFLHCDLSLISQFEYFLLLILKTPFLGIFYRSLYNTDFSISLQFLFCFG